MIRQFSVTAFLLLFNFGFIFSMKGPVDLDLKLNTLVDSNFALKSKYLRFYLKDFARKQGFAKKITAIIDSKNVVIPNLNAILNLSNNICVFCKKENVSCNVLVITLVYFEKILDKWKDSSFKSHEELLAWVMKILMGSFIIAYKYYEEGSVYIKDLVGLCKEKLRSELSCGEEEIKSQLCDAEELVFKYLDFNASVPPEVFEYFSCEICNLALDPSQIETIRSLDGVSFIKKFVDHVDVILFVRGIRVKDNKLIQKFVSKFISCYSESENVFDVLTLSLVGFQSVARDVIGSINNFDDDVLLFVLFGFFMISDMGEGVDWDSIFLEIFPEHLRRVNASNLYKSIASFSSKKDFDDEIFEVIMERIIFIV